jgi:ectoine hydroxylase-related dioxygenase (phytanoyl-CoA dioxygenase family)
MFLNEYGFIHFKGFISAERMHEIATEYANVFDLVNEGIKSSDNQDYVVTGLEDNKQVQRIPFLTKHSPFFQSLITNEIHPKIQALGFQNHRIGFEEKNGVVATRYNTQKGSWSKMGWHTDIGNSPYYVKNKMHYFNVGLHLDDSDQETGCLKVLPKTHKQSVFSLYTKKAAFLDHRKDPSEISIETEPGDLTVHDGRLWHRVSDVSKQRRVLYFNLLKGKKASSKATYETPTYMKIFMPIKRFLAL